MKKISASIPAVIRNIELKKHSKLLNKHKNKEEMSQEEIEQHNLMKYLKKKNKVLKK